MTGPVIDQPAADRVGGLARTGISWSAGLIVTRQLLGIVVASILARLLLPSDYGLLGMVTTLFALLSIVGDMGLSWATIQRKDLTQAQSHNLFWINTATGVLMSIVVVILAPVLADFYGEARLLPVAMVLGVTFAFGGLGGQPLSLMRRQLKFKQLTLIQMGQYVAGAGVALALAALGAGYWALVAQNVSGSLLRIVLAFYLSGYRPRPPQRGVGTMQLLRFGGYLTGSGFLIYFQRNLDNVLIGKVLGVEELGYYSRAYFLMMLPSILAAGTLSSVMTPALSALQGEPARFGAAYRKAARWLAVVSFPVAAGLALVSDEAIRLVYGEQWLPVVPILAWLSIVSLTNPIYGTYGWLFTAVGKGRVYLYSSIAATIAIVTAFSIGIQWGVVGLAAAYAIVMSVVVTVPMLYVAHRAAGLEFAPTLRVLRPAAIATAAMSLGVFALGFALDTGDIHWMPQLVAKVAVGGLLYVALVVWLDAEVRTALLSQRSRLPWRRSSMSSTA